MKTVYETTNAADAQVVADLLHRHEIGATVVGEQLGPYTHALGAVRVLVAADEEGAAREVVAEWESAVPAAEADEPGAPAATAAPRRPSVQMATVLLGAVLLLVVLWYFTGV